MSSLTTILCVSVLFGLKLGMTYDYYITSNGTYVGSVFTRHIRSIFQLFWITNSIGDQRKITSVYVESSEKTIRLCATFTRPVSITFGPLMGNLNNWLYFNQDGTIDRISCVADTIYSHVLDIQNSNVEFINFVWTVDIDNFILIKDGSFTCKKLYFYQSVTKKYGDYAIT